MAAQRRSGAASPHRARARHGRHLAALTGLTMILDLLLENGPLRADPGKQSSENR
jgi:hypothetical protein